MSPKEQLGLRLFNDMNLSANSNQSCASCHGRDVGGTGPNMEFNAHGAVYEGSVAGRFGNRKPPSTRYATLAPRFDYAPDAGFTGGAFWDGRATGWKLGTPAADQAEGPFLNPVEQALPDSTSLVSRVCASDYGLLFRGVWGKDACADVERGFADIATSIAAFEDSPYVNSFGSKYDFVLAGRARLSTRERRGLELFEGKANCSFCHISRNTAGPVAFSDFGFDNLGIPPNPENPFYDMDKVLIDGEPINPFGSDWIDPGLAGFVERLARDDSWRSLPFVSPGVRELSIEALQALVQPNYGKHRVPTLRNVDLRPEPDFIKAYGHNGFFKSLRGIVHFYNTRDVLSRCEGRVTEREALEKNCWPASEVSDNRETSLVGNLGLTQDEEADIVAFLGTLSDGWRAGR